MSKSIAVIAAHPDDEVLGCGGTIARHNESGDETHVLIMAEGITSRNGLSAKQAEVQLKALSDTAHKANSILGVDSLSLHGFADNRMDSYDRLELIKVIEDFLEQYRPAIIYTHHSGDLNIDHRRVHEAVVTACRPYPGNLSSTLLFFEVASSTNWQTPGSVMPFLPNWYVNISETLGRKIEALQTYKSEMRPWPHTRSIDAVKDLAKWRGATVGCHAAEAFMLGRNIT